MQIRTGGSGLRPRLIIHGPPGCGKTSLGANFPDPVFLMSPGETGLLTLVDNGLLPEIPYDIGYPTFDGYMNALRGYLKMKTNHKTFVIDTLNGVDDLFNNYICSKYYGGDWSKYQGGYHGKTYKGPAWSEFLGLLEEIRTKKNMCILLLMHTKVKPFQNPLGDDYNRYQVDMQDATWSLTVKWADAVLFYTTPVYTNKESKRDRAKATGGTQRVLYTEGNAGFDAKQRLGLPDMINMGKNGREAWLNLGKALAEGKKRKEKLAAGNQDSDDLGVTMDDAATETNQQTENQQEPVTQGQGA